MTTFIYDGWEWRYEDGRSFTYKENGQPPWERDTLAIGPGDTVIVLSGRVCVDTRSWDREVIISCWELQARKEPYYFHLCPGTHEKQYDQRVYSVSCGDGLCEQCLKDLKERKCMRGFTFFDDDYYLGIEHCAHDFERYNQFQQHIHCLELNIVMEETYREFWAAVD